MCLILLAYQQHNQYPFVVAANRDEFYKRATKPLHLWGDHNHIVAGRDLKAGGTWMGINKQGQFAAVTNIREGKNLSKHTQLLSRGNLCADFLNTNMSATAYLDKISKEQDCYAGFNLLIGEFNQRGEKALFFFNNRGSDIIKLEQGVYGISNGTALNDNWQKTKNGKLALQEQLKNDISHKKILAILSDRTTAPDHQLPNTGIDINLERQLSSRFIVLENYGTRSSTALTISNQLDCQITEKTFHDSKTDSTEVITNNFSIK